MSLADVTYLPETPAHDPEIDAINEEAFGPGRFARAAYKIREGGLEVYPRLVAAEHRRAVGGAVLSSGVEALDALLGGGIERGTSTLVVGPPGTGKSSLAVQFVSNAARQGLKVAMFVFDESLHSLLRRSECLGMDLQEHIDQGLVSVQQVDPAELSPGEFVHAIRAAVEEQGVAIVVVAMRVIQTVIEIVLAGHDGIKDQALVQVDPLQGALVEAGEVAEAADDLGGAWTDWSADSRSGSPRSISSSTTSITTRRFFAMESSRLRWCSARSTFDASS